MILWVWKYAPRSHNFIYVSFRSYAVIHANLFFPMCQNISLITWKYLISSGVEQALMHISILFQQIGLSFFPFLLFLLQKENACTHTDLILSYYLPAVTLKCQALTYFFFFPNISSGNIWIYATLILASFLLFLFGLSGTCECPVHTQWHQTLLGNLILLV